MFFPEAESNTASTEGRLGEKKKKVICWGIWLYPTEEENY